MLLIGHPLVSNHTPPGPYLRLILYTESNHPFCLYWKAISCNHQQPKRHQIQGIGIIMFQEIPFRGWAVSGLSLWLPSNSAKLEVHSVWRVTPHWPKPRLAIQDRCMYALLQSFYTSTACRQAYKHEHARTQVHIHALHTHTHTREEVNTHNEHEKKESHQLWWDWENTEPFGEEAFANPRMKWR